jgi:hypothetical protein
MGLARDVRGKEQRANDRHAGQHSELDSDLPQFVKHRE